MTLCAIYNNSLSAILLNYLTKLDHMSYKMILLIIGVIKLYKLDKNISRYIYQTFIRITYIRDITKDIVFLNNFRLFLI